ncbi:hypothetical protein ALC56_05231 [Trachymyrmex septentrionalis]|uniref:Uncharacterized protein n=1 Tax=Trachymyrmex septentrionalis TaxID=34720 RepID=A0A195FIT9_9HYME|nr:hypothetical protein ALC56_05231 [Trachymyrmex septentrionalis]
MKAIIVIIVFTVRKAGVLAG